MASSRSPRNFGNTLPRLGSPTWWPARPIRWSPRATEPGDSTWITRSTAPMSIPSSSELVATIAFRRAALELVLDLEPLLASDRAVVGSGELLAGELVETGREALGQAAGVDEHDRRTVRPDQLEYLGVDGRPDRRLRRRGPRSGGPEHRRHPLRGLGDPRQVRHVLDRHDDLDLHRLAEPGVDDRHGTRAARGLAAEEPRDLLERSLGGGQADALRGLVRELLEAFEREREMRAPLGTRHRVDLVHDHPADAPEDLARLGRQHQVERLRRGDQDVGRTGLDPAALARRGVAGAHRDARLVDVLAEAFGREPDARQRRPQVLLDVDGERSERRDVQDPAPLVRGRWRVGHHAVERPQERRERLARTGRGEDQRMPAAGDRRPPCACAAVGVSNVLSNHARTAGRTPPGSPFHRTANARHGRSELRHRVALEREPVDLLVLSQSPVGSNPSAR